MLPAESAPLFYHSTYGNKSKYQQQIEKIEGQGHAREMRALYKHLNFPLTLGPGEMQEGQISIGVPADTPTLKMPFLLHTMVDMKHIEVTFIERVSGQRKKMKMGDHFDATRHGLKRSKGPSKQFWKTLKSKLFK
jgi:hypothetical protein